MLSPQSTLHLDQSSHVVALITTALLKPASPETSLVFERAADIQKQTGCRVTILHLTERTRPESDVKELISMKILVQRANQYFDTEFGSTVEYAASNFKSVSKAFGKLGGDLLLKQHAGDSVDKTDTMSIDLLNSASFPVWFTNSDASIDEISARVNGAYVVREDDVLTCHVANTLGVCFESDVHVLQAAPRRQSQDTGDLVVTCVPSPNGCSDEHLKQLRHDAASMLRGPVDFDLLVRRGCEVGDLSRAA